jgi:hypothetical protein
LGTTITPVNVAIGFDASKLTTGVDITRGQMNQLRSMVQGTITDAQKWEERVALLQLAEQKGVITAETYAKALMHEWEALNKTTQAEKDAAKAKQETADARKKAAEDSYDYARSMQMKADRDKEASDAKKAQESREAAEESYDYARSVQMKSDRDKAESDRKEAERKRKQAEESRKAANDAYDHARSTLLKGDRDKAESDRKESERKAKQAADSRKAANDAYDHARSTLLKEERERAEAERRRAKREADASAERRRKAEADYDHARSLLMKEERDRRAAELKIGVGSALAGIPGGGYIAGGALAYGAWRGLKDVVHVTGEFEQAQVAMEVLLGSQIEAKKMLEEMIRMDVESTLSLQDYQSAGKLLLGYGVSAKQTIPIMEALSKISLGNSDRFYWLAKAMADVSSKGHLMAQELNQMTNQGFNPLRVIMQMTGKDMTELQSIMSDYGISFDMVVQAIEKATTGTGKFADMNERMLDTMSGQLAKLKAEWVSLKRIIGESISPEVKGAAKWGQTALQGVKGIMPNEPGWGNEEIAILLDGLRPSTAAWSLTSKEREQAAKAAEQEQKMQAEYIRRTEIVTENEKITKELNEIYLERNKNLLPKEQKLESLDGFSTRNLDMLAYRLDEQIKQRDDEKRAKETAEKKAEDDKKRLMEKNARDIEAMSQRYETNAEKFRREMQEVQRLAGLGLSPEKVRQAQQGLVSDMIDERDSGIDTSSATRMDKNSAEYFKFMNQMKDKEMKTQEKQLEVQKEIKRLQGKLIETVKAGGVGMKAYA